MSVPIYRAAYIFEDGEDAEIRFSGWVQADGRDEMVTLLEAVNPANGGAPAGETPTILGWEELVLEDPELD